METRDYFIVAVIVGLIVWWFTRRKAAGCGCGPKMPAPAPAPSGGRCGPFACGPSRPAPRRN